MATLTGHLVADTYKALLKLIDNDILTASEKQISDGFGGGSNVFIDQNGFLRAAQFKVTGGTSSQFLKGDGSLDSNTYYLASNPSGFINVATANTLYLPIGSTTTAIAEGTRLYFTTARVLATTLTGFVATSGTVTASDTILTAIDKIWWNIVNGGGGGGGYVPYTGATQNLNLGTYGLISDFVQFNVSNSAVPTTAGTMSWNNTDGTADLKLKGGNVTLQVGQEQVTRVVNKTGTNLLESQYHAVYISGAQGQRLKVDLALAVTDGTSAGTLGLVTENINNNQEGFVTSSGLVNEIDTTGDLQGETWADGDILYLSPLVAGDITNVKPLAPEHTVIIGFVVYAHANHGKIYVKVDNGYEIEELHDVQVITRTDEDILQWYEDDLVWRNIQFITALENAGGISGLGDINYVPRFDGTNSISNSLIFDDLENVIIGGTIGIIPNPYNSADMLTVLNGNISVDPAYAYHIGTYQILYRQDATGEFRIGTNAANDFTTFYANGSERVRITTAGYLGVGLTAPSSIIHAKDSTAYGKIIIDNTGLTGGGSFSASQNGTETAIFGVSGSWATNTTSDAAIVATRASQGIKFYTNGSSTAKGGIDSVGNSFIGQLPTYYAGATNFIVKGISAAALIGITHFDDSIKGVFSTLNSGVNIGSETPHPVIFRADDIESARIASDGKWLFGTNVNDNVNIVQVNGSIIATSLKKSGGIATEFLKADGSVDSNLYYLDSNPDNYIPLTAISSTAFGLTYTNTTGVISLTAGFEIPTTTDTTNWDIAYLNRITSATAPLSITTNVISISQASGSVNGYLSSTDWTTFNNKANALSGTTNYIPKFTSGSTIGNSLIYDNGATITISGTVGFGLFNVQGSISTLLGLARGIHLSSTLVADANGDVLVGLDLNPTFTNGAFTGVNNYALRIGSWLYADSINNRLGIGTATPLFKLDVVGTARISGVLTLSSTISNGTYTYTLPSATGTLALTSDLNSYVPTSRSLTINGTAYDLSADRTWSVGTVTSVSGTGTVSGLTLTGSVTTTGSLTLGGTLSLTSLNVTTALGFTPVTNARTLTINGTTYDLTADRSWTIAAGISTLTTLGTSGPATLVGSTLNVPNYSAGSSAVRNVSTFTATSGQTTFTISGGYTVGLIDVFINGARLSTSDFTATNSSTVVLGTGAVLNDIVDVVNYTATFTAGISGTGTANYLTKWTGTSTVSNSVIYDDGTNVGIGTITPAYKLDVVGMVRFTGMLNQANQTEFFASAGASNRAWSIILGNVVAGDFNISTGSTATGGTYTTRLAINPSGAATFSNSVTATDLIITDTYLNDPLIKLATTTSGNVEVQIRTATTTYNAGIGVVTTGYDFGLFTNNITRMAITSGGIVNLYSPTTNGDSLNLFNSSGKLNIKMGGGGGGANQSSISMYNSSNTLTIGLNGAGDTDPSFITGYLAIGTTTNSGYRLYVSGTVYSTGGYAPSDRRFKNKIIPISYGLNEILKLNPVSYEWNKEKNVDRGTIGIQLGFIAQEVKDILPTSVLENIDEEKTLALKYTELIPVVVKAIQELSAEIDQLKAK